MLATCEDSLIGARDRALLLLVYETARRRSELVALAVEDLIKDERRIAGIWLRKSKNRPMSNRKKASALGNSRECSLDMGEPHKDLRRHGIESYQRR